MMKRVACAVFCAWAVGAGAETLTWNGKDGDAWDGAAHPSREPGVSGDF